MDIPVIALAGNPNTGKSTIFNALTGLKQHTGNWSGKTVGNAWGRLNYGGKQFDIVDLPGIYSTEPLSEDEKWAVDFIEKGNADAVIVVLDATCLERNLLLALEILNIYPKVLVCINLIDEAARKKIYIDHKKLENMLGTDVILTSASRGEGIDCLKEKIYKGISQRKIVPIPKKDIAKRVKEIYSACVTSQGDVMTSIDRKIDNVVMSKIWGFPIMLALLCIIFWITVSGANYISDFLASGFECIENYIALAVKDHKLIKGIFVDGMFHTLSLVVSVMLPPMAIFFPMFTLLEDLGYLPRMAFNLDRLVKKAKAHGKMVLTMCMGLGCNSVGVTACRIIDSPRERLIAILTNNFVPCNGRFPGIIMLSAIFFAGTGAFSSFRTAVAVLGCIVFSAAITLLVSRILSDTLLKGTTSSVILELPPYRKPRILSVIWRSITDRTVFVLGRAMAVAAPAGAIIWILRNFTVNGVCLLDSIANFLAPLGNIMGLDGYILTAFILGLPANEIVIPLIIMCYTKGSSLVDIESLAQLKDILVNNGWTLKTAICTIIFSLNHFPCSTTLLTIKKETGSLFWTAMAFIIPTVTGILLCFTINMIYVIINVMT